MDNLIIQFKNKNKKSKINVEQRLVDILLIVGISANLQGYSFLKQSIKLAIDDPSYINSITKNMYPKIASMFNTTPYRVERAIRHALEVAFNKGKIVNINEVFGLKIYDEKDKPTNSEFVALIADRLSLEML